MLLGRRLKLTSWYLGNEESPATGLACINRNARPATKAPVKVRKTRNSADLDDSELCCPLKTIQRTAVVLVEYYHKLRSRVGAIYSCAYLYKRAPFRLEHSIKHAAHDNSSHSGAKAQYRSSHRKQRQPPGTCTRTGCHRAKTSNKRARARQLYRRKTSSINSATLALQATGSAIAESKHQKSEGVKKTHSTSQKRYTALLQVVNPIKEEEAEKTRQNMPSGKSAALQAPSSVIAERNHNKTKTFKNIYAARNASTP